MEHKKRMMLISFIREIVLHTQKGQTYKRKLRNSAQKIDDFSKYLGKKLYTDSFTYDVTNEYIIYLRSRPEKYRQNTVRNFLTNLFVMLTKAGRDGYSVNYGYKDVRVPVESSVHIYLTEMEIERIFNLKKLSKEAYNVREWFVLACCTGFRISDIYSLDTIHFINGNVEKRTKKTAETVIIPQHRLVKQILERNNNVMPKLPSQQAYNTSVKRLCRRAGITDKILVERIRGTQVERKLFSKYMLVTSHTARRSLATNMYLAGIATARIMLITGHKTEQSFFKYIRINKRENAEELANHPFFK